MKKFLFLTLGIAIIIIGSSKLVTPTILPNHGNPEKSNITSVMLSNYSNDLPIDYNNTNLSSYRDLEIINCKSEKLRSFSSSLPVSP